MGRFSFARLRLSIKIPLLVGILILLTIAAVEINTYRSADQMFRADAEADLTSTAGGQADNLNNWLNIRVAELTTMAQSSQIRSMWWVEQRPLVKSEFQRLKGSYDSLMVMWPNGRCLDQDGTLVDVKARGYFQEAIKGKTVLTNPSRSGETGSLVMTICVPLKDNRGKTIGVLAAAANMDSVTRIVNETRVGKSGYTYLVQNDGCVMAYPNRPEWVLEKNFRTDLETDENLRRLELQKSLGEPGRGYYTVDGAEYLQSYAPITLTGWTIGAVVPVSEIDESARALLGSTLWLGGLSLLLAVLLTMLLLRFLVLRPISLLDEVSRQVAGGDLGNTIDVKSQDELGELTRFFNQMIFSLKELVQQIGQMTSKAVTSTQDLAQTARETERAAEEIAVSVGVLAREAADEAELTRQTSQVVDEMNQALENLQTRSKQVGQISEDFQGFVGQGMDAVSVLSNTMNESIRASEGIEAAIQDLNLYSREIDQFVEVITNIASQTNLLALNAAIEAARAGEEGRGFAVVAEEVRGLAEGSAQAASQINKLIKNIQQGTLVAVEQVSTSKRVAQAQANAVDATGQLFKQVEDSTQNISQAIGLAAEAVSQINASIQKAARAMDSMSSITRQSADSVQQTLGLTQEQNSVMQVISSSAQEIAELINQLEAAVSSFKL